ARATGTSPASLRSVRSRAPARRRAALYARNAESTSSAAVSRPVMAGGSMRVPPRWERDLRAADMNALTGSGDAGQGRRAYPGPRDTESGAVARSLRDPSPRQLATGA